MNILERLTAIEAIRQSKARYARGADTKDWELFGSAFAEDAVWDLRGFAVARKPGSGEWNSIGSSFDLPFLEELSALGSWPVVGREAIRAAGPKATDGVVGAFHALFNPEIDFVSEGSANVRWPFEETIHFAEGAPLRYLHGFGYYNETYECVDDDWLIKTCKLWPMLVEIS